MKQVDLWHARHVKYEGESVYDLEDIDDDIALLKCIAFLEPRSFQVLYMRFFLEFTLRATGHVLNISVERTRQIEAKAVRTLRHTKHSNAIKKAMGWPKDIHLCRTAEYNHRYRHNPYEEGRYKKLYRNNKNEAIKLNQLLKNDVRRLIHDHNLQKVQQTYRTYGTDCPPFVELRFQFDGFPYLWVDPATGMKCERHWNPEVYDEWLKQKLKERQAPAAPCSPLSTEAGRERIREDF